jgi:hypothetical protein
LSPDHFSAVAGQYAASRPTYPDELFDWLAGVVMVVEWPLFMHVGRVG